MSLLFSIDMLDKRRIDIYFVQEFVISMHQASWCLSLAAVGCPNMHKALLFLYVYNSTLCTRLANVSVGHPLGGYNIYREIFYSIALWYKSCGEYSSKCIGKEVTTKYFLPGDLKLNLSWLGFPNYLYWCVDSSFCSEFIESKQKKEEKGRKIFGRNGLNGNSGLATQC